MRKTVLLLLFLCETCLCYKILLVCSFARTSHYILGEGYVRHLLNAGHEVTFITPGPINTNHSRLRQIDISSIENRRVMRESLNFNKVIQGNFNKVIQGQPVPKLSVPKMRQRALLKPVKNTIYHENVQKLIHDPKEEFDVVIASWMLVDLVGCGLAAVFDCPLIWATTMETTDVQLSVIQRFTNPAYTVCEHPTEDPPFTFWTRLVQLYKYCLRQVHLWLDYSLEEDHFKKAFGDAVMKKGRVLPSYHEARYNASLVLANSYVTTGVATDLPQNYKQIGGYHIAETVKPLPEDIQALIDNAQHGVIYFSLGTVLQTNDMLEEIKNGFIKVFAGLKQTVIWKIDSIVSNVPTNVHIVKWASQQSILAHKNCILFITHGGLLSVTEAVHFGVPIIGIPFFGDQVNNVRRAAAKGFGKRLTPSMDLPRDLKVAIDDVIGNSSYMEKAKEISSINSHRLVPPGRELVFWVEHVVLSGGARHLRGGAAAVPPLQRVYLDWLLLLVALVLAAVKTCRALRRLTVEKLKRA